MTETIKPEDIRRAVIEDEMRQAYLDYSMSVIVGRALPDVRDGLKPVHRRILFAMNDMGMRHNTPYKKCARVVGEVLGKYHPHGDVAVYDSLVRMAQTFSLRVPLIQGQGNFGCFTKDTKVALVDGRNLSFGELIKEYKEGKKNYTYTIDKNNIKITEIKHPRLTKINQKLIKVVLDNGEEIKCTLDHKFMLRNGKYKEAKDLKSEESLMPLYNRLSQTSDGLKPELNGYTLVLNPSTKKWVLTHHLSDEFNINEGKYSKSNGRIRHHVDFNKQNNNPENIIRMKWKEHWLLHSNLTKNKHINDPDYIKKLAKGRENFWSNEENRKKYSERLTQRNKENWKNETYRKKMISFLSQINKEYHKKHPELALELGKRTSERLKKLWKTKEYRKIMNEKIVRVNKQRLTNNTGKKKFLNVCKKVLETEGTLNPELYEKHRQILYTYGSSTSWDTGFNKYYENEDIITLINDACENHKIACTEILQKHEDVYDLTIEGTHNFALAAGVFVHNSQDGDGPAAMRYTETRLAKVSQEMLLDIDKETVDFTDNFDGSLKEPTVLPSKIPNLLINGSTGIAVGMATNIPPHNLKEISSAVIKLIDDSEVKDIELLEIVKGPDFPTGGIIAGNSGVRQAYMTGRGKAVIKARIHEEEFKGHKRLIVSEIPYMIQKADLVIQIADCVKDKKIEGISDLRDESDRKGMRIVIELKKDVVPELIIKQLYSYTRLQDTFGIILLALVDNKPKVLTLREILNEYIKHRQIVVRRKTEYEKRKAEERAHILEGLVIAIDDIDNAITLIKKSSSASEAKESLMEKYSLTKVQSQAILDMKLQKLAKLEHEKIRQELLDLKELIKNLTEILADEQKILNIIKEEQREVIENYADERRTEITDAEDEDFDMEDLIPEEEVVVMMSNQGYVKRMPLDTYRVQRRGGVGIIGAESKEDDFIESVFTANTHSYLLVFTGQGKVHWVKVYRIPESSRYSKGKAIINLVEIEKDDYISAVIPVKDFDDSHYLVIATKKGTIKKTELSAYSKPRRGGIRAITLEEGDDIVTVALTDGKQQILLGTKKGRACKFNEKDARSIGRTGKGVRGIKLKKGDK